MTVLTINGNEVENKWLTLILMPFVAVIILVPSAIAVNIPVSGLIVPTLVLLLLHVTVAGKLAPFWSSVVAVKVILLPIITDVVDGEIFIEFRNGVDPSSLLPKLILVTFAPFTRLIFQLLGDVGNVCIHPF